MLPRLRVDGTVHQRYCWYYKDSPRRRRGTDRYPDRVTLHKDSRPDVPTESTNNESYLGLLLIENGPYPVIKVPEPVRGRRPCTLTENVIVKAQNRRNSSLGRLQFRYFCSIFTDDI